MRVMILVKATVASETGEMPSPQRLTAMAAYHDTLIEAGILLAGEGPKPSRCGKRVRFSGEARTVSDGPFAESPETHAVTSEPRLNPRIRRFLTTVHNCRRSNKSIQIRVEIYSHRGTRELRRYQCVDRRTTSRAASSALAALADVAVRFKPRAGRGGGNRRRAATVSEPSELTSRSCCVPQFGHAHFRTSSLRTAALGAPPRWRCKSPVAYCGSCAASGYFLWHRPLSCSRPRRPFRRRRL